MLFYSLEATFSQIVIMTFGPFCVKQEVISLHRQMAVHFIFKSTNKLAIVMSIYFLKSNISYHISSPRARTMSVLLLYLHPQTQTLACNGYCKTSLQLMNMEISE